MLDAVNMVMDEIDDELMHHPSMVIFLDIVLKCELILE